MEAQFKQLKSIHEKEAKDMKELKDVKKELKKEAKNLDTRVSSLAKDHGVPDVKLPVPPKIPKVVNEKSEKTSDKKTEGDKDEPAKTSSE